jgi:serine/arginine repetitive matrix protein 2
MIGGGHVRRNSVAPAIQASPCTRVEKRKSTHSQPMDDLAQGHLSPKKARITEKPSIVSTSSSKFGGERMVKAAHGLLQQQSLEESCLVGRQ